MKQMKKKIGDVNILAKWQNITKLKTSCLILKRTVVASHVGEGNRGSPTLSGGGVRNWVKYTRSPKNVRFLSVKTQFYMNGFILRKEWRMWAKVVPSVSTLGSSPTKGGRWDAHGSSKQTTRRLKPSLLSIYSQKIFRITCQGKYPGCKTVIRCGPSLVFKYFWVCIYKEFIHIRIEM